MVIQRLQSLYLLLAIIAMTLVFYLPFGLILDATDPATTVELVTLDYPILLVLNSLITLLLLIDIFLFKNLRLSKACGSSMHFAHHCFSSNNIHHSIKWWRHVEDSLDRSSCSSSICTVPHHCGKISHG